MATVYESSIDNEQIDGAFALAVDARFDDLDNGFGQKIFDFNNGDNIDNIWLGQVGNSNDIEFTIVVDGVEHRLVAEDALVEGEYATWRVGVDRDGTMRIAKNSDLLAEGVGAVPEDVDRFNWQIGESSDPLDSTMSGIVLNLKLANYGSIDELNPESSSSPCAVTGETTCLCDKLYPDADIISGNDGPAFVPESDPEGDGEWSPIQSLGVIAIHSIVLPDGKVLSFGTNENGAQTGQFVYTLYDPETGIDKILPNTTETDIFCSNMTIDPVTGNVIIMGGDSRGEGLPSNWGVNDVVIFDYRTENIRDAEQGEMEYARWYGTTLTLANSEIVHLGGVDENGSISLTPEVFNSEAGFRTLTDATMTGFGGGGYFPHAWVNSRGEVIILEPSGNDVFRMTTEGTGTYEKIGEFPFASQAAMPSIMFDQDKVARLADDGGLWVTDISEAVPTWTRVAQMDPNRYDGGMVMLPDGRLAVSGGSDVRNNLETANKTIEIWDPVDNSVEVLAEGGIERLYHASHVLLPDGTIFVGGGGAPGPLVNTNFEIFAPDYLYSETGERTDRPDILEAPSNIEAGSTFTMRVQDTGSVDRITVVKSGAMTHSRNSDTMFRELDFVVLDGETIEVLTPNNFVMTPGLYMLFILDGNGVPSRGEMLGVDMADLVETPNFEAEEGTLAVYAIDDDQIDGAFELIVEARFDDLDSGSYQRVFDFGNGPASNNIVLGQVASSADMYFAVFDGSTQYRIIAEDVIIEGVVSKWTVSVDETGYMRMWRNDMLVAEGQGLVPNDVHRELLVGMSHWGSDDDLRGEVRLLETINEGDAPEYVHLGLPTATFIGPLSVLQDSPNEDLELIYTLKLSNPAQNIVTADVVLTGDGTGPEQIVIATGQQFASFTINVAAADLSELAETVTVSLENLSQARATSVLTVSTTINGDPASGQLLAEYFTLLEPASVLADIDFEATPDFSEQVSEINQYAGTGAFYAGGPTDQFAVRYTGDFQAALAGAYTFYLNSDDGSRLFIDGVQVINNDGLHGQVELAATIDLSAGAHTIEVRYFENAGGAVVDLDWAGPGFARQQMAFEIGTPPAGTPPTAEDDGPFAIAEDTGGTTGNVLTNDTDPDAGDILSVASADTVTGLGAAVINNADGTFTIVSNGAYDGLSAVETVTDSFTYTVTDSNDGSDVGLVTLTVTGVDDDPGDPASGQLLAEYFTLLEPASVLADIDFEATPDFSEQVSEINQYAGTGAFYAGGPTDQFAVRYTGDFQAALAGAYTFYLNSDDGSRLFIDGVQVINNDGLHGQVELAATIDLSAGAHTIEVRYFENAGGAVVDLDWAGPGFARQQMAFEIGTPPAGTPPTAEDDGPFAIAEDTGGTTGNVLTNDTDPDAGDILSVASADTVTGLGAAVINNADGTFTIVSNGAYDGLSAVETVTDSFTYTVTDSNDGSDVGLVTLTVTGVDDDPGDPASGQLLAEYFTLLEPASVLADIDFEATPDFSEQVSEINQYAGTGAFYAGGPTDQFAVRYTGDFQAALAGAYTFYLNSDDGSRLFIDGVQVINNDGLHGQVELAATIDLSAGAHTIEVRYFENAGGAVVDLDWAGPGFARQQMAFEIGTPPAGTPPTAEDDGPFAIAEDTGGTTGNVLTNDTDPDAGDILSVASADTVTGLGAAVINNADGTFTIVSNGAYDGLSAVETVTDSFTYTVTDSNDGSDVGLVTLTVTGVDDDPGDPASGQLLAEYFTLLEPASVLADIDFEATPDFSEQVSEINQYAGTGAFYAGGPTDQFAVRYTGDFQAALAGAYTFYLNSDDGSRLFIDGVQVINNDGLHGQVELAATIDLSAGAHTIEVRYFENAGGAVVDLDWAGPGFARQQMAFEIGTPPAGTPPTAEDDGPFAIAEDTGGTTGNVLTNDTDPDAGDILSVASADTVTGLGAAVINNADGTFTIVSNGAYDGLSAVETVTNSFTYTVTDSNDGSDVGLVTLTVTGVDDDPGDPASGQLLAEYFTLLEPASVLADIDFEATPDFSEQVSEINQYAGTGAFYAGGPTDQFAVRYTGDFQAALAGAYTFYLNSDDGSRLFIDGVQVINNDGLHGQVELAATIDLSAGAHTIEVRYFENAGGAVVDLDWAGPGFARQQMAFEIGTPVPSPVLSISAPADTIEGDEGTTGSLIFTVSLSMPANDDVTADVSISGGATGPSTLIIPEGQENTTLSMSFQGDSVVESDEQIAVTLSNIMNAIPETVAASALILDDEMSSATARLQVGSEFLEQSSSDSWFSVSFDAPINEAVVVMGPVTYNDEQPAMARVRNVTETGFEWQIDEWDYHDGFHVAETVTWMAMSAGTFQLPDGRTVTAGQTILQDEDWSSVGLTGFTERPVVFAQVASAEDGAAVVTRLRNVEVDSFDIQMQEEEAADGIHGAERVDYIAIEEGNGASLNVGITADVVTNNSFEIDMSDEEFVFFADMQTRDEADTASIRYFLRDSSVSVFVNEEGSLDIEDIHTTEIVGWLEADAGVFELA